MGIPKGKCFDCDAKCAECISIDICTRCEDPYYYLPPVSMSVESCPIYYTLNVSTSICEI